MSSIEANKALVRRYFDTFNAGALEKLEEILAPDYGDRLEGQSAGIGVIRSYLQGLKASFPDFTWTIEQIIAEGDRKPGGLQGLSDLPNRQRQAGRALGGGRLRQAPGAAECQAE